MLLKIKILEIFTNLKHRYFKSNLLSRQTSNLIQFHSGGDDYSPLLECEGLGGSIGNNPANGVVFAWRDDITRKSLPGEKRIYAIKKDKETQEILVASEIHLKNNGTIEVSGGKDLNIVILGDASLSVSGALDIEAASIASSGDWIHDGNFTAAHIEAGDGASGSFDITSASKGIVTGGS